MPGQAHWPRRHPAQPAAAVIDFVFFLLARQRASKLAFCSCFVRQFPFRTAFRSVIDSATPAVQGGLLTAGAGAHPARYTGIGLALRPQPDPDVPQARCSIGDCPATPASRLALTMTPLILCLHFIPSAPSCFRFAQGYRCCEPWAPPSSVAILRSLACTSPPVAIARAQHQAWNKFKARCCRTDNSGIDEHKRNRYCVSDALTHVSIITAQCHNCPAYSAFNKSEFVTRSAGRLGDPVTETKGKNFLFNL